MNSTIAELANNDLRNAATILYRASIVLKNLPGTAADADTKTALFVSAKTAIKAARIVLNQILDELERIEVSGGLIK